MSFIATQYLFYQRSISKFLVLSFDLRPTFKENTQFVQKVTCETLMDLKSTYYYMRLGIFLSFLHLSYRNTQLLFFVTVLSITFMRQTLTEDFLGVTQKQELSLHLKFNFMSEKFEFYLFTNNNPVQWFHEKSVTTSYCSWVIIVIIIVNTIRLRALLLVAPVYSGRVDNNLLPKVSQSLVRWYLLLCFLLLLLLLLLLSLLFKKR